MSCLLLMACRVRWAEKLRDSPRTEIELQAWGAFSTALMIDEMQELAVVQARFSEQELGSCA